MSNKLYVGNLALDITDIYLRRMFCPFGSVRLAAVTMDQVTSRSKGFGFVEMWNEQEAQAAIAGMNGKISNGRTLTVSEANQRVQYLPVEPSREFRHAPGGDRFRLFDRDRGMLRGTLQGGWEQSSPSEDMVCVLMDGPHESPHMEIFRKLLFPLRHRELPIQEESPD